MCEPKQVILLPDRSMSIQPTRNVCLHFDFSFFHEFEWLEGPKTKRNGRPTAVKIWQRGSNTLTQPNDHVKYGIYFDFNQICNPQKKLQ